MKFGIFKYTFVLFVAATLKLLIVYGSTIYNSTCICIYTYKKRMERKNDFTASHRHRFLVYCKKNYDNKILMMPQIPHMHSYR